MPDTPPPRVTERTTTEQRDPRPDTPMAPMRDAPSRRTAECVIRGGLDPTEDAPSRRATDGVVTGAPDPAEDVPPQARRRMPRGQRCPGAPPTVGAGAAGRVPDPGRARRWWPALGLAAGAAAALLAADRVLPPPLERAADLSTVVVDRSGRPLRVFTTREGRWRLAATVDQVAPVYLALLLAREDRRFFRHPGVDPLALARALVQNLRARRTVSGASTLTMQVARLLEPRPRTLTGKLAEALRAVQIERRLAKREVLALYLTLAPFGGNLEGVRAASRALFGKEPGALSTAEAALLVALPQAPSRLRPDRAPEAARAARDRVLARARAAGVLSPREAAEAAAEPVPTALADWPPHAPHLAERLRASAPGGAVVATTLDGGLQRAVEGLARRELPALIERAGLALLVVDNASREVLAHLGAPDYLDATRHGWIDMTTATRSPGSALKPFVYGLAFDDRVARPETIVEDVSTRFGEYAPQNFDQAFRGELTVREALQRSLNVPAVLLLERVGPARLAGALARAGVRLALPPEAGRPGLPLALGGLGMTLGDLTAIYAGLAADGEVRALRLTPGEAGPARRLLSPGAAAEVVRILAGAAPPPGAVQAAERRRRGAIALKTGTSYGFRDAWAFGVTRRYTVGVWVGRPDGSPSPDHLGRTVAAPILYRVFDLLPEDPAPVPAATLAEAPAPLLRRIEARDAEHRPVALPDPHRLRLVFPQPGTVLELPGGTEGAPTRVMLEAAGGRRPLTWLVDGRVIARTPADRSTPWAPRGPGPARVVVIDAEGRAAMAEINVR